MDEDRITSLPDHIIHCIFKFMEMKDVVQTSLLSKRWTSLWLSNPYLTITYSYMWDFFEDKDKEDEFDDYDQQFEDFVDHVLFTRHHTSHIQTFSLNFSHHPSNTQAWFSHLYYSNIQEVQLSGVHVEEAILKTVCGKVKSLTLIRVIFFGDEESGDLFLSCPFMEILVLQGCIYFKLKGNYYNPDTYCDINISAQNLKLLEIQGFNFSRSYTLDNLSALVTAVIDVNVPYTEHLTNTDRIRLNNIFGGLVNAKSLTYSAETLQVCLEDSNTLKRVATLQNLRYLKLTRWKTRSSYISSVLKLLEKCPNVETLVLEGYSSREPELRDEDLGADLLSWCMLCHLKTVDIKVYAVFEIDFKFLKFLMKNTKSLENVVLTMCDARSTEKEKLVNLYKKLEVVPKVRYLPRVPGFQLKLRISSSSRTVQWETA